MLEAIIAIIMSFVGTNIDDIFINLFFFAQADSRRKTQAVIMGQYLGMGVLVFVSCLGAYCLQSISQKYIGFLGFVPIALGIKEWVSYQKSKNDASEDLEEKADLSKGLMLNVMLVTISNGADNIGVYIPLFAGYTAAQMIMVCIVFAVMLAFWCVLGKCLADLPVVHRFLLKYKHIIVPVVLVVLGVYIFMKGM